MDRKGTWFMLAVMFIALLPLLSYGQTEIIRGTILDADTELSLIGAHVILQSNWRKGAISDSNGEFTIEILSEDLEDSVIISFVGYDEKIVAVPELRAEPIILMNTKSKAIASIEIVSERLIAEEFSIVKIDRLDIYKNPSAKADVLLAVNSLPSSTTVDETANVSFRGSSPEQTGIFFNQVPVYDAVRFSQLNGIGTFSFFNTDIIKNVQVFASNPPLDFGNVTSGMLAIQTEDQPVNHRFTSVILSLANVGFNHRQGVGKSKRSGFSVFGNYQFSEPLRTLNQSSLADILSFNSKDIGVHFVHQAANNISLKVFNYTLNEGYDYNFRSPSYVGIFRQSRFNNLSVVNIIKKYNKSNLSINLGNRWSHQLLEYSKARFDITNNDVYASVQYHKEEQRWGMKTGIAYDGRFQRFEGNVPTYEYAQGPQHPFESIAPDHEQRELLDIFFYYKFIPWEALTLGLAVRKNIPWNNQDHYLSRQFNLDYKITPVHNVKFALGTFNQYLLPGQANISPRLKTNQLSLDYQYTKNKIIISSALFYKDTQYFDKHYEQIAGSEISFHYKPIARFSLDMSYTGLMVTTNVDGNKFSSLYDLPYFVRLGIEWNPIQTYTIGIRSLFRAGSYFQPLVSTNFNPTLDVYEPIYNTPSNEIRYPPYNLIDLSLSAFYSLGDHSAMVIFFSVGNVFNFQNIREYSYNWDFSVRANEYYSQRTIYFGGMISF